MSHPTTDPRDGEIHDSPVDWVSRHIQEFLDSDGQSRGARRRLLLTTRGARTGKLRRTALYFWQHGDDVFVVASNGGAANDPQWYRNLTADPEVTVQLGPETFRARARTATAEEKAPLWDRVVAFMSSYESFQSRTQREIPIVILERTG